MAKNFKTFSKLPSADEVSRRTVCPLCGAEPFEPRWEFDGSVFVSCAACTLVYQNPRPESRSAALRYDEEYFRYEIENQEMFFSLMMRGLADVSFFDSIAPGLPDPLSILDIGCATGRLLHHFQGLGWDTAGVELCGESAEYGRRTFAVDIRDCSLHEAAFPACRFSAVHASHLIEHVDDPLALVREVERILKPGGIFICVTPSIDGFQARLFGSRWRSAIADHLTLFGKDTLQRLLESSGLRVEAVKTWGGLAAGSAPMWLKRPMDLLAKRWNFGDVVLMAARKPAAGPSESPSEESLGGCRFQAPGAPAVRGSY